jgi:hypothetical protein
VTGLQDHETTGLQDHETTGLRDYKTAGLGAGRLQEMIKTTRPSRPCAIIKSSFHFGIGRKTVPTFLRLLGVGFKGKGELGFWEANKEILPEIYAELQAEVREKFHELHPDKGGDAEEFRSFLACWGDIKKQFARHLPLPLDRATSSTVVLLPSGTGIDARREKERAYARKWHNRWWAKHKDEPAVKERNRRNAKRWQKRNPDKRLAINKRWQKRHPETYRAIQMRYRQSAKGQATIARQIERARIRHQLIQIKLARLELKEAA